MWRTCALVASLALSAAWRPLYEQLPCSLCGRPVWAWQYSPNGDRPIICHGAPMAAGPDAVAQDQDSCFARAFVGVN